LLRRDSQSPETQILETVCEKSSVGSNFGIPGIEISEVLKTRSLTLGDENPEVAKHDIVRSGVAVTPIIRISGIDFSAILRRRSWNTLHQKS
jgi:hypothetical protein